MNRRPGIPVLILAVLSCAVRPAGAVQPPRAALVMVRGVSAFEQVRAGFLGAIPEAVVVELEPDLSDARSALERLQGQQPSVVVSLGTSAALAVEEYLPTTPQIFSMVLDPDRLGPPRRNRFGYTLEVDPKLRIEALRKLFTPLQAIAVLRSQAGEAEAQALADAGKAAGIRTTIVVFKDPGGLGTSLAALPRETQAILLTTEAQFLKNEVTEALLLRAFRARIPVIGFTGTQTRLGSMASLEIDYRGHGAELARAAVNMATGVPGSAVRPVASYHWVVNTRSARALNLAIPDEILDLAGEGR